MESTDEESVFLSEIRHSQFLEREEAYHKMNIELEKKTTELMAKMDKYSKSRSYISSNYGGGDTASEYGTDDGMSMCSDMPYSSRSSMVNGEFGDFDDHENYASQVSEKLSRLSTNPSTDEFPNDPHLKKQKSRLQRATESVIKSLQAKLVNHEERLTDLHLQYRQKIQENTMQDSKIKALEEERERLLRTISNQQNVVDKHAKNAESSKSNLNVKSQTVSTLKREIEDLKKDKKQSNTSCQSNQTRLHRAVEEIDKLKCLNKSMTLQLREIQADNKLKLDEKQQRIIELEKQRNVLNSTISKQAQVIKLLREQKVIVTDE